MLNNNSKLKSMMNTLVKEDFLQSKKGKLLLDNEMPSKLQITSSTMPITSKELSTNIKVFFHNQDSITPFLQLSSIQKVWNYLMEHLSLLKKIFQNLWNVWELLMRLKLCTLIFGKIMKFANQRTSILTSWFTI